jgi:hypothetical protein
MLITELGYSPVFCCVECKHIWKPRGKAVPKVCPKCHTEKWLSKA